VIDWPTQRAEGSHVVSVAQGAASILLRHLNIASEQSI
jgi:hypothetical protein